MSAPVFNNFTTAYLTHLRNVAMRPTTVSPRGMKIREALFENWTLANVDKCRIDWSQTGKPERQALYDRYAENELTWYLTGSVRADSAPSAFWRRIADVDGNIVSNYGNIILCRDQYPGREIGVPEVSAFEHVIAVLSKDRDSRQAIMHYNLPQHFKPGAKDIPCTLTAQVWIRDEMLSMWVSQRSSDLWFGMPYDIPWHCWLIRMLADKLGAHPGVLHHSIGSLHVYEHDMEKIRKVLHLDEPATPTV